MTTADLLAAVRAQARRLTHHGHDGDIDRLIEIAWVSAREGRILGCQRAVHAIQAAHPDGIYALLNTAADRALAARSGDRWLLGDDTTAWIVRCRALGDHHALRRDLDPRSEEERREIAVDLLCWAAAQAQGVAR